MASKVNLLFTSDFREMTKRTMPQPTGPWCCSPADWPPLLSNVSICMRHLHTGHPSHPLNLTHAPWTHLHPDTLVPNIEGRYCSIKNTQPGCCLVTPHDIPVTSPALQARPWNNTARLWKNNHGCQRDGHEFNMKWQISLDAQHRSHWAACAHASCVLLFHQLGIQLHGAFAKPSKTLNT